jgi:hypothetical protein
LKTLSHEKVWPFFLFNEEPSGEADGSGCVETAVGAEAGGGGAKIVDALGFGFVVFGFGNTLLTSFQNRTAGGSFFAGGVVAVLACAELPRGDCPAVCELPATDV